MIREIKLDDWKDGHCDAWDYEAILHDNNVIMEWDKTEEIWFCSWKYGLIEPPVQDGIIAKKAVALFISLWLLGVSASFCDKLMDGYIMYLKFQDKI